MDWNNDGRKDLITGEYDGHIRIYLNSGTDAAPLFTTTNYLQVAGTNWYSFYTKPEVADWNNDGKKDILCGNSSGNVLLLLNVGTDANPIFNTVTYITNGSARLTAATGYYRACPVVVDWNRDGKKDLIVGDGYGNLEYYENLGTDANPVFNGYTLLMAGGKTIEVGYYAAPEAVDWDNDGWKDLLVGSAEVDEYGDYITDGHVFYFHALSGPYLKSSVLRDASGDGYLERGETCSLTTVLTNSGASVSSVVATLATTSSWCTVTAPNWTVGDFALYQSRTNTTLPFSFVIATNAPFGVKLPFTLAITGNGGSYRQTHLLSYEVAKPSFALAGVLVNDAAGNGNCTCNPSETVQLMVKLTNSGYRAEAVTGQLIPSNPDVILVSSNATFGTIERNTQAVAWQAPFAFTLPATMPSNAIYGFTLKLSYRDGSQTTNLSILLGDYVVTSNTPFAWIDMSAGTNVVLTYYSYRTLPLGFNFPFYGLRPTNYVHLVGDGYAMFGTPYVSYSPRAIPDTRQPNLIIAPWWELLDPSKGGTIRYRTFGIAPNRYWVAEFANVPRYYYTNELRNFQVILDESGSIKFQYGPYSGTAGARVIGLENADGTLGKAWTTSVTNGVALLFSVQAGTTDSDADGLPDAYELFYFGSLTRNGTDDTDQDGASNLTEFRAGTNPNEPASRLRLEQPGSIPPGQLRLSWPSIPGRPYSVWRCTDASLSAWTNLTPTPLTGTAAGTNYFTNAISSGAGQTLFRLTTP